ncbi:MAG: TauD/TfdA family dioxygenase [Halioglobus sp.]|nr:TauD/TfdA family dioxygenase [Halioglobus sp.]
MDITPFTPGCGAVVSGIQLAGLKCDDLKKLRNAFSDYGLLFFRDQKLSKEDHVDFAERWGSIVLNKFFQSAEGYPNIAEVRKEQHQETNIGGGWHADHSYDKEPALGSILVARSLPDRGGDTCFADAANAFDALSPGLQQTLEGLRALHSNEHLYGEDGYYQKTDLSQQLGGMDRVGGATHPMVIRHPDSGRKVLFVNPGHTIGIEGWSNKESFALLNFLYGHTEQDAFTCRFNWLPGSVAFWDNRRTWHLAKNDYRGQFRLMHRITLKGVPLLGTT